MYLFYKQRMTVCAIGILSSLLFIGCSHIHRKPFKESELSHDVEKIVVLGFKPAIVKEGKSNIIQSPLSGNLVMADTVSQNTADRLTVNLFEKIPKNSRYQLISPDQSSGIYSGILSSDNGWKDIEIYQKIGQSFSADTVLTGYVYRWEERKGSNFSVSSPASVSFDLYLIRTLDKSILWRGQFDKTQRSLSENILDMGTFLKGKGRWMTADELADIGLEDMIDDLFAIIE